MLNIRTLLFEDVNRAKKILKDLNIPETDPRYTKLRKLLEKNIGYLGTFTNFMFNEQVEYDDLVALYERMLADPNLFKKLPKPFIQYTNFNELQNDINRAEQEVKFQKLFKALPKNVREMMTRDMNNELRERLIGLSDDFLATYDKLGGASEEIQQFYSGFARITGDPNGNANQLVDSMQQLVDKHMASKDYQEKIKQIQSTDGAEVVYTNPANKIIVAAVNSFAASQKLGSPNWCIANHLSNWNYYTKDRIQYMIWDYNYDPTNKLHEIGATLDENGDWYTVQDALNYPISDTFGTDANYFQKIGVPMDVLTAPFERIIQEKQQKKFEAIKAKSAEQVNQDDIRFLMQKFNTPEQLINFIGQNYGKMPRFALSHIMGMAGDKQTIIPEILKATKGKFVDEDDFYYMLNTDNIKSIYPDIDPEKFRDSVIAYIKKARTPDEYDNALVYSYLIHNLNNFEEAVNEVGIEGLAKLSPEEINYLVNLAIAQGNKGVIDVIRRARRLPDFKDNDYVDMIELLDQKKVENPVQKVVNIFGNRVWLDVTPRKVAEMIMHLPDHLFQQIFQVAGQELVEKLTTDLTRTIDRAGKFDRIRNFVEAPKKPEVPTPANPTTLGNEQLIYSELLKAKGKTAIDGVVKKYGKSALRTLSPTTVAKVLKVTDHPDKLVDVFGRELVQKAMEDPSGGSVLKQKLNKSKINPDSIAEENDGFDFLGIHSEKPSASIVSQKDFQIPFIHDLVNGLKNTLNWKVMKNHGRMVDKYTDNEWDSMLEEFEFDYDYDGRLIPMKIYLDNREPIFTTGDGKRFRMDWINPQMKEILLRNLDKK